MPSLRDDDVGGISQDIAYLSDTASTIERRLLRLVKEAAKGEIPLEDLTSELSLLSKDLRRCYRQVVDMKERRDLSFEEIARLQKINRHCVWLYRKTHLEQAFYRKLHFETKLRSLISTEAFSVYQELLNAEEQEREFLAMNDAEITRLLLEEDTSTQSC